MMKICSLSADEPPSLIGATGFVPICSFVGLGSPFFCKSLTDCRHKIYASKKQHPKLKRAYTLKRNNITSPSCTMYSFPSNRTLPASFADAIDPVATKSS